jgi:hypothetical protein
MSAHPERLWPPEEEQPQMTVVVNGESHTLRWDNCYIQIYRTRNSDYDDDLKKYNHVVIQTAKSTDEEGITHRDFVPILLSDLTKKDIEYLIDNAYPFSVDPMPDGYILDEIARIEGGNIPDFLE